MFKLCVLSCLLAVAAAKPSPAIVYTYSGNAAVGPVVAPAVAPVAPVAPVAAPVAPVVPTPLTYTRSLLYPGGYPTPLAYAGYPGPLALSETYPAASTYAAGYPAAYSSSFLNGPYNVPYASPYTSAFYVR
ncbi:hypothetical protein JYU34_021184 [Plutella xylostella]|uniref:Uncharacterized protein n=1 Tax=Plutella xylostella TaxID=51655 RepID=A0ABQ7PTH8_PLUXY|nr:hypothetical protein JYU34_021184 [Plutella xylostella]